MHVLQSHDSSEAVAAEDRQEDSGIVASAQGARSRKKGPKQPQQKAFGRHIDLSRRGSEQGASLLTSICYYYVNVVA